MAAESSVALERSIEAGIRRRLAALMALLVALVILAGGIAIRMRAGVLLAVFAVELAVLLALFAAGRNAITRLGEASLHDPLTGLYNRRFLDETLEREITKALRARSPLCVLMVDIDHFKDFNDLYGHEAGDAALQGVAASMRATFRAADIVCRYGGEEFMVLLPGSDLPAALERADAWREALARLPLGLHGGAALPPVRVSIGVAALPVHGTSAEALVHAADDALYSAKRAGRNRVIAATSPAGGTASTVWKASTSSSRSPSPSYS